MNEVTKRPLNTFVADVKGALKSKVQPLQGDGNFEGFFNGVLDTGKQGLTALFTSLAPGAKAAWDGLSATLGNIKNPLDIVKKLEEEADKLKGTDGKPLAQQAKDELMATKFAETTGLNIEEARKVIGTYRDDTRASAEAFSQKLTNMGGEVRSFFGRMGSAVTNGVNTAVAGAASVATAVVVAATPAPPEPEPASVAVASAVATTTPAVAALSVAPVAISALPAVRAFTIAATPPTAEELSKKTVIVLTKDGLDRVKSEGVYAAKDISGSQIYLEAVKALQDGKFDKFQQATLEKLAKDVGAKDMEDLKSMIQKPKLMQMAATPVITAEMSP